MSSSCPVLCSVPLRVLLDQCAPICPGRLSEKRYVDMSSQESHFEADRVRSLPLQSSSLTGLLLPHHSTVDRSPVTAHPLTMWTAARLGVR